MTSLKANITILLLLSTFEVESKRIHIDFIGCYKRPDVIESDHSTNRLYYPIYRRKLMECQCSLHQLCRFGLNLAGRGRRAKVKQANILNSQNHKELHKSDRTELIEEESPNDTLLPPLPPITSNLIVAEPPKIECNGQLYLNGKPFVGKFKSGLYECWSGKKLLRQDLVQVITIKKHKTKVTDKSRCTDSSLVCFNGGTCVRGARSLNKPICQCKSGFTGVNCSQRILSFDLK